MNVRHRFKKAARSVGDTGFSHAMSRHVAVFFQRSHKRLVVTFDNMKSREVPGQQFPWAYSFIEAMGPRIWG